MQPSKYTFNMTFSFLKTQLMQDGEVEREDYKYYCLEVIFPEIGSSLTVSDLCVNFSEEYI